MNASSTPAPADGDQRAVAWKVFGVLMLGALVGALGILPYALALTPPSLPPGSPPLAVLLALSVLQTLVLAAIAAAIGLWLGPRVGLGARLLTAWLAGERGVGARLRALVSPSVLLGLASGVAILVLEIGLFAPRLPQDVSGLEGARIAPWQGFLASFYGGIVEEILLRLGLMTLFVWAGAKLARTNQPGAGIMWTANLLAAVLFGLGHLPATAALLPLTPLVVTRALVLNGLAGLVFGWLYWRKDLLAAIVAHFSADLVLHVLAPMLLGRG